MRITAILGLIGASIILLLAAQNCSSYQAVAPVIGSSRNSLKGELAELKSPAPCAQVVAAGGRVLVALILGQSNAANFGETPGPNHSRVWTFHEGACQTAIDPLPGPRGDRSGTKGSVWSRLGPHLLERGLFETVIFVPIAVGGTSIQDWSDGEQAGDLTQTLQGLALAHLSVTHVLFHQGERDTLLQTSSTDYSERLQKLIRKLREASIDAPIFVSVATYNSSYAVPISLAIQASQKAIVNPAAKIYAGPNTDLLTGPIWRFTEVSGVPGLHLSTAGLQRVAELWTDAIEAANP